jgi:hypothetical protein
MIQFASERDETGSARFAPVDTYTEILGLTNAAYLAQQLHHHLKSRLGLVVLLSFDFCSAVRMASFISTTNDRPEAFSSFSCAPPAVGQEGLDRFGGRPHENAAKGGGFNDRPLGQGH